MVLCDGAGGDISQLTPIFSPRLGKYLFKPDDELPPSKPCYYTGAGHETPSVDPYNVSNANGNGNGACYQINGHYNISTRQTVRPPRLLGTVELKNLFSTFPNLRHPNPNYMDVINFARDAGEQERASSSFHNI